MLKPVFILIICSAVLGITSCTKCVTCSATWTDPVDSTNTQIINSYEYCGNKKDVKEFEDAWKTKFSDSIYTEVECQ